VIGALCLLVLASMAIVGPYGTASRVGTCDVAARQGGLQGDSLAGEAPGGVPVSISIRNDGHRDERLLGGSTPVAQCVGIRDANFAGGRHETAPALEGIVIPAGAMITLEPGKSHLALFGVQTDLIQGETFPLTLRFERAGEMTVIARVRRRVDAAGVAPLPEVSLGDLTIARASAPPAPGR
jgi:periplasmic copper chaperone A